MSTETGLSTIDLTLVPTLSPSGGSEKEAASPQSPFQTAVLNWIRQLSPDALKNILVDPRGCGLDGQIAFNKSALDGFVFDQFFSFFNSLSRDQQERLNHQNNRMGWKNFFSGIAGAIFDTTLMHAIERGMIPHPRGIAHDSKRVGMPGSLEDDTQRAIASIRYNLEQDLASHLKYYSLGAVARDLTFIQHLVDYLGVDESTTALLLARVLDHYGLPNLHTARRNYGARLQTALYNRCYGVLEPSKTPDAVIADQSQLWPEAYLRLPLLDAVLAPSFDAYDPSMIEAHHQDLLADDARSHLVDSDHDLRLQEGQAIVDALRRFRAQLVGNSQVLEGNFGSFDLPIK